MLLWLDGQAHYDTARIGHKYSTVDHTATTWTVAADGRFGNCLKRVAASNFSEGSLTIAPLTTRLGAWVPEPYNGGVCGFAIKVDDLTKVGANVLMQSTIFRVLEGNTYHLRVNLNPSGTFSLIRNIGSGEGTGGPLILAQSIEGLSSNTWMYVEFKWVIHDSAGSFAIRVNGIPVLTYSGNTVEGDAFVNSLKMWTAVELLEIQSVASPAPLLTARMCDLYLADLVSTDLDDVSDFLGDGVVETILPDGVGATTGWTPLTGPNWQEVNDTPAPDDEASYIAATPAGTIDTYTFQDVPTTAVIKGIHVNILARKTESGSAALAPLVRQGGTDYAGPTQGVSGVSYDRYLTQPWDLNPATGAQFTAAEINAGQFGVKKVV